MRGLLVVLGLCAGLGCTAEQEALSIAPEASGPKVESPVNEAQWVPDQLTGDRNLWLVDATSAAMRQVAGAIDKPSPADFDPESVKTERLRKDRVFHQRGMVNFETSIGARRSVPYDVRFIRRKVDSSVEYDCYYLTIDGETEIDRRDDPEVAPFLGESVGKVDLEDGEPREWSLNDGMDALTGRLTSFDTETQEAVIEDEKGKVMVLPLWRMSEHDREFVRSQAGK